MTSILSFYARVSKMSLLPYIHLNQRWEKEAIGSTVGLEALFAGPICGASMNPIRSIAPAIASGHFQSLWIYIAGPLAGMLLAVMTFNVMKEHLAE